MILKESSGCYEAVRRRTREIRARQARPVKRLLCLSKTKTRVAAMMCLKMSLRNPREGNKYVIGYMILEGVKI